MKKALSLLLAGLLLAAPALSCAADLSGCSIANGVVSAARHVDVTAPCSGTLLSYDLEVGDAVTSGQTLMQMMSTTVYAPEDGKIGALFIAAGDDASAAMQRYGCVMTIEPEHLLMIEASVSISTSDTKNRMIHTGETVYALRETTATSEGSGRVIRVSGNTYLVELTDGDLNVGNSVNLYRDEDHTSKNAIGKGSVVRREDALVQGAGRVLEVYVREGDAVKAGDRLFTVLSSDAAPGASDVLSAPNAGVISALPFSPGQQVWKGALLCRIELTDQLEVTASVDEIDLRDLRVGDSVQVTLDMDEERVINGTVTEISGLGVTRSNAAYYTVRVSLPSGYGKLGCIASVYLPK